MPLGEFLAGAAYFSLTVGAAGGAAWLVMRRHYAHLALLERLLAFAALATAAVVFAFVAPAALGVLARWTALLAALTLLAGAWLIAGRVKADAEPEEPLQLPSSGRVSIVIAAAGVFALVVYEVARLRVLATNPILDIDMLEFHLPGVARWIQTGSIWQIDQFEPGFATAQYPNNGDFLSLSAVMPWNDLAFARLAMLPYFALTGVAMYALALRLLVPRATAAIFAAAALAVPSLSRFALEGLPDVVALSMLAIGVLFLMRHASSRRRSDLVLAGLALGLSMGTKWYGLTALAVVLVVWTSAWLLARVSLARLVREGGTVLGMVAAGGGIWLVRNVIESGNPLYPKEISIFGVQLFAGSRGDLVDQYGYTIAHYVDRPRILKDFIYPGFKLEIGLLGLVIVVGLGIGVVAAARTLRSRQADMAPALLLALIAVTLGLLAIYALTPGSAYGPTDRPVAAYTTVRWLMPAVVLGAAAAAGAAVTLGRWRVVLELAALTGLVDGIRRGPDLPPVPHASEAKVAVALAIMAALAWFVLRHARGRLRPLSVPGVAIVVIAGVAILGTGRVAQKHFDQRTYAHFDPTFAWILTHAPSRRRIALSGAPNDRGLAPVLPAFGPRLRNRVTYVGPYVGHTVKIPRNRAEFLAALGADRYELLLVGRMQPRMMGTWARSIGWRPVAQSPRFRLYVAPAGLRPRG